MVSPGRLLSMNSWASRIRLSILKQNADDKRIHGTLGSKLTTEKVREIRKSDKSKTALAAEYNVHVGHIGRILNDKIWKEV